MRAQKKTSGREGETKGEKELRRRGYRMPFPAFSFNYSRESERDELQHDSGASSGPGSLERSRRFYFRGKGGRERESERRRYISAPLLFSLSRASSFRGAYSRARTSIKGKIYSDGRSSLFQFISRERERERERKTRCSVKEDKLGDLHKGRNELKNSLAREYKKERERELR